MKYPELMIEMMRRDLARHGVEELRTPEQVDEFVARPGTALLAVNSRCGCSAATMRPAVGLALRHPIRPDRAGSVFAGQDIEATNRARELFLPHPPSSPAVALFRDGELLVLLQREHIQGRTPEDVAAQLTAAFEAHCAPAY